LLVGSGPVDRDENYGLLRVDATRQIAGALASAGIASLRYDKRGVGKSQGGDWRAAGFFDAVDDAAAAFAFLAGLPEVDGGRVGVIGHSEGAFTATALVGRGAPLAAVVLLAGSAVPGSEVGRLQAERVIPTLPFPIPALVRLLRVDLNQRVAKSHARLRATSGDVERVGMRRTNARWQREFLAYDPAVDLARCSAPVLAITGGKDLQIDPNQLEAIASVVPGPVKTSRPPDLTHTLRRQPRRPSLLRYSGELRRPVDAELLAEVTNWTCAALQGHEGTPRPGVAPRQGDRAS
jgi:pimeloyl-ACP methyl ester carboxylesterase